MLVAIQIRICIRDPFGSFCAKLLTQSVYGSRLIRTDLQEILREVFPEKFNANPFGDFCDHTGETCLGGGMHRPSASVGNEITK